MLLFDDSKKLEKALGEEAAAVLVHVFEKADDKLRSELATKADIQNLRENMATKADIQVLRDEMAHMATKAELAATKNDILRWMVGGFLTQTALIVAILAFLR